jgi:hypothetical protein
MTKDSRAELSVHMYMWKGEALFFKSRSAEF